MKGLEKRDFKGKLYVMSVMSFTSNNTGCKHICLKTHSLFLCFIWAVLSAMDTVHSTLGHSERLKQDSYSLICRLAKAEYVTVINTDAVYRNRHVFRLPHATVSPES